MKRLITIFFCCSLIYACKNDSARTVPLDEVFSSELPEDFLSFYMKFHADSSFQLAHIVFPLKAKADGSSFVREDWLMHRPFDDNDGEYTQDFINMNGLITERISSTNQVYKMERRFIKSGGNYQLIYYHVDNAFRASEEWNSEEPSY